MRGGPFRALGRAVARHRRLLAAALAAASVAVALQAARPAPPPTVEVYAAARDLSGGAALTADDLRTVRLPEDAVPSGAVRVTDGDDGPDAEGRENGPVRPAGKVLAGPVRAGEPLTDVRLVGRSLVAGYGPGRVATPVRMADPGEVALLHAGDRIDVLAASPEAETAHRPAQVVARNVPVVSVPTAGESEDGGTTALSVADDAGGGLVVLATGTRTAAELASAASTSRLSLVLRP